MAAKGKTWPQFMAMIMIHEIMPRCKKSKIAIENAEPKVASVIVRCEFDGYSDRHETRRYLDGLFDMIKKKEVISGSRSRR